MKEPKFGTLQEAVEFHGEGTALADAMLDGDVAGEAMVNVDRRAMAIHRLARAVEALAKTPIPLPAPGPTPGPSEAPGLPKRIVATAYVCEECNARNVVAAKIQHSPNCPLNPNRKGK